MPDNENGKLLQIRKEFSKWKLLQMVKEFSKEAGYKLI